MEAEIILTIDRIEERKTIDKSYETHKIYNLYCKDQLIATIDSIIKNALVFLPKWKRLTCVNVMCNDKYAVEYIKQHSDTLFRYHRPNLKVVVGLGYMDR